MKTVLPFVSMAYTVQPLPSGVRPRTWATRVARSKTTWVTSPGILLRVWWGSLVTVQGVVVWSMWIRTREVPAVTYDDWLVETLLP